MARELNEAGDQFTKAVDNLVIRELGVKNTLPDVSIATNAAINLFPVISDTSRTR